MKDQRPKLKSIAWGWVEIVPLSGPILDSLVTLSLPDRDRAARFRREEDRLRFVAGRGLLTALLQRTGEPHTLSLALTEHGRPFFPDRPDLAFSISHAGKVVAVALSEGSRVGLDVEMLDREVDLPALSARIFNPTDLAHFRALLAADQTPAFFHAWTGKEAVLKARGIGLFGGLTDIAAPLNGHGATLVCGDATWHLRAPRLPVGYVGCLAYDGPGREVFEHTFSLQDLR
jgi:4'-phosphopantetheinyl transferase